MPKPFVIAVDGPAASGKGTIAKRMANHFGLRHLDTGLLYRAVGAAVLEEDGDLDDPLLGGSIANRLDLSTLDPVFLAQHHIGEAASKVAAHPSVRDALLGAQRSFATVQPGAVLDGRDIGTVVCPDADAKLFITASLEARAHRRQAQATQSGQALALDIVKADLAKRDARDAGRADAPMQKADDARLLDTTNLSIDAALKEALQFVDSKRAADTF